jgi:hypothetical protein
MAELAEKERLANRLQNLLDLLPGGVIVIDDRAACARPTPRPASCWACRWKASCGAM